MASGTRSRAAAAAVSKPSEVDVPATVEAPELTEEASVTAATEDTPVEAVVPRTSNSLVSAEQQGLLLIIAIVLIQGTLQGYSKKTPPEAASAFGAALSQNPSGSTSYFANKSNLVNQIFAKKAWGWTTLAFLINIATDVYSYYDKEKKKRVVGSVRKRVIKWIVATLFWASLTVWMIGPGLLERSLVFSGAKCAIKLPKVVCNSVDCTRFLPSSTELLGQSSDSETIYLTLPTEFCTRSTSKLPEVFHSTAFLDEIPRPRWSGGHDVSGHTFLLTLAALFLLDDVAPILRSFQVGTVDEFGLESKLAACFSGAIILLWVFVIGMTARFFHTVTEKITGYALGLAGFLLVQAMGASA